MGKSNGKSEREMPGVDLDHELPPSDGEENPPAEQAQTSPAAAEASSAELQKLKAERDALLDRLARALEYGEPVPAGIDEAVANAELIDQCYRRAGLSPRPG